jgi:hypothetical protein
MPVTPTHGLLILMSELWKIRAEITVEPQDFPSGDTVGFMNIITWADSSEIAQAKIEAYFATFNWHVVGIEEASLIPGNFVYEDEGLQDMIERARDNPDAIICGTFHSYKVN